MVNDEKMPSLDELPEQVIKNIPKIIYLETNTSIKKIKREKQKKKKYINEYYSKKFLQSYFKTSN